MAKQTTRRKQQISSAVVVGHDAKLWQMADALRSKMDAAEYKHAVLGLNFLKNISDAFESQHEKLVAGEAKGADPEDRDEYRAANIFWVHKEARWPLLKANAPQPTIGKLVDDAMSAIENQAWVQHAVLPGVRRGTHCARIMHRAGAN